jgi:methyl-accepting chemotaxis protein
MHVNASSFWARFSPRHVKTATKLVLGFLGICVTMGIISGIDTFGMAQINSRLEAVAQRTLPAVQDLDTIRLNFVQAQTDFRDAVLDPNTSRTATYLSDVQRDEQQLQTALNDYSAIAQPADAATVVTLHHVVHIWQNTLHAMIPSAADTSPDTRFRLTIEIENQWSPQTQAVFTALDQLHASEAAQSNQIRTEAAATFTRLLWVSLLTLVAGVGIAMTLALILARHIARPLVTMIKIVNRVARGNLRPIVTGGGIRTGTDEMGQFTQALSEMVSSLRTLVSQVAGATQDVNGGAQAIAELAQHSDATTTVVAQVITGVVSSVVAQSEQLHASTQAVTALAERSHTLHDAARTTQDAMDTLHDLVCQVAERVRQLGTRSQEIDRIVQAIEGIAEQTNLLALNAAIEAARAGEHGRGFAVVAAEVRKLAERAGQATKEIGQIIRATQAETTQAVDSMGEGVSQVEATVCHVQQTQAQAREMATSATQVQRDLGAIAEASDRNRAAATDVLDATHQMAERVSSTLDATRDLGEVAQRLRDASAVFTLEDAWPRPLSREHQAQIARLAARPQSPARMERDKAA